LFALVLEFQRHFGNCTKRERKREQDSRSCLEKGGYCIELVVIYCYLVLCKKKLVMDLNRNEEDLYLEDKGMDFEVSSRVYFMLAQATKYFLFYYFLCRTLNSGKTIMKWKKKNERKLAPWTWPPMKTNLWNQRTR